MTMPHHDMDPHLREKLELLRPVLPRDPGLASQARQEFLAEARSLHLGVSAQMGKRNPSWIDRIRTFYKEKTAMLHPKQRTAFTMMASLAAALVFLFGGAGMTAYAARTALPGDRLYSVKIAVEEAQVTLSRDSAGDAQLYLQFAERRLDEMAGLIEAGRLDDLGAASDRFQQNLQESISGLRSLAIADPAQGAALVSASADTLARYGQILTSLLETAPQPAQLALKQAIQASQDSLGTWKVEFTGVVEAVGDVWIIDGKAVAIRDQTEIKDGVGLGDRVKVEALRADDGALVAIEIEPADDAAGPGETEVEFTGRVEIIESASWTVEGWVIAIAQGTEIKGEIGLGDLVKVEALRAADGTLTAKEITLASGDSSDEDDGDDDVVGSEVEFTGQVQEKHDGYWVIGGRAVSITGETEIKGAIEQGDLVKVEAHESEDGSLVAHEIELVDDDDDDIDDDDDDDDDGVGSGVEFTGPVQEKHDGYWVVGGRTVSITGETEIKGAIEPGDLVKVEAHESEDGSLVAHEIELVHDDDDGDDMDADDDDRYEESDDDHQSSDSYSDDQDDHDGGDNSDDHDDGDDPSGQSGSGGDSDDDDSDDHDDDHEDEHDDDDDDDDDSDDSDDDDD